MKKFLLASLLLCQTAAFADWLPASEPIPIGTSGGIKRDVNTTYNASNQTIVAAWANTGDSAPYYAVYDGSTWTTPGTPIPLGASAGVNFNTTLTYDAANQTVIAFWSEVSTQLPFYAVFDGSSWTTPGTALPIDFVATGVYNDIHATYDPATQTVIAAWADSTTRLPYYTVFDGTAWSTAATFSPGGSTGILYDINLIYNAANQTVVAAWADVVTQLPYYAIYNGTSWTTLGSQIPPGTSSGVNSGVIGLVYDASNQTVIAAWGDLATFTPYYAVFNGFSWTSAALISPIPRIGANVYDNISLAFDSTSQAVIAAWSSSIGYQPYYSIFNGTSWTSVAPIPVAPSAGIDYNVNLVFNPAASQTVATWGNYPGDPDGFFNIFASEPVFPPATLTVNGCSVNFATQSVWINQLVWTPSLSLDVVTYNIYRNGVLIGIVSADTFQYNDPVNTRGVDVYGVTSVNSLGTESAPVTVTVTSRGSGLR